MYDHSDVEMGPHHESRFYFVLLPGRIRLHSKKLIGNAELGRKVYAYIASYKEIDKVDVNVLTGSVLITYRPQVLQANRELVRVENYIMTHVERRR